MATGKWSAGLRILHPVLLLLAMPMVVDNHRNAALLLILGAIAVHLTAIELERAGR